MSAESRLDEVLSTEKSCLGSQEGPDQSSSDVDDSSSPTLESTSNAGIGVLEARSVSASSPNNSLVRFDDDPFDASGAWREDMRVESLLSLRVVNTDAVCDSSVDVDRVEENEIETGRADDEGRVSIGSDRSSPMSRTPAAGRTILSGGGGGGGGIGGMGNFRTGPCVIRRK